MIRLKFPSVFAVCLALSPAAARALEIPLKSGGDKGTRVGFVDMDKIFREFPDTQKAKLDYYEEVNRRKKALTEKEQSLVDLRRQLEALKSAVSEVSAAPSGVNASSATAASVSTATLATASDSIVKRQAELDQKSAELEKEKAGALKDLKDFEKIRTQQVLGSLYKALIQLCDEKGIGLVVDKSAILYGQDAIDLTGPLSRRIRGLPEEEAP